MAPHLVQIIFAIVLVRVSVLCRSIRIILGLRNDRPTGRGCRPIPGRFIVNGRGLLTSVIGADIVSTSRNVIVPLLSRPHLFDCMKLLLLVILRPWTCVIHAGIW